MLLLILGPLLLILLLVAFFLLILLLNFVRLIVREAGRLRTPGLGADEGER